MPLQLTDYRNGILAFDAGFVRPQVSAIYLIVDAGRVAFVDTGINASLPRAQTALTQLGLGPESVDFVILTHIHLDHAGGAGSMMGVLPNARLVVHPRGVRHMIDPGRLMAATEAIYGREKAQALYGELLPVPAGRVMETADGMVLRLGGRELAFHEAPGHARHQNFIHDRTANGIFSGDAFGIAYPECDVAGLPLLLPSTTPSQFDPVDLRDTVEHMIALAPEAIYPTHFQRLAPPRPLAESMLRRLDDYVRLTREALASATADPLRELKARLSAYVLDQAHAHGVMLADSQILELWKMDIDLNAQGLLNWAQA